MYLTKAQSILKILKIYRLYMKAFPASERKPFASILKKCRSGSMEMLSIEEKGAFLGLAITICNGDMVLLDYFAVAKNRRSRGVGSEALKLLKERYQGRRFFLEIETTKEEAEDLEERKRRKAFYLRNGFAELPFDADLFGVHMEMLGNGCCVTFREYHEMYREEFGEWVASHICLLDEWEL